MIDQNCRVALAALLHDLGKFAERADIDVPNRELLEANIQFYARYQKPKPQSKEWFSHVHAAYTGIAMDILEPMLPPIKDGETSPFQHSRSTEASEADDTLINAAAMHHKPETYLQWIIATAERAASGHDREYFDLYNNSKDENQKTGKNHYTARQYTLFEQIELVSENTCESHEIRDFSFRYALRPLSPTSIFPVNSVECEVNNRSEAQKEYGKLWDSFIDHLKQIPESHKNNLPLWLDHFETLWLTFTHSIPSATAFETISDISLFDHSKVVAALATAIWNYHFVRQDNEEIVKKNLVNRADWDESKLLFIQGDLSGIQEFIFDAGGESTKQAAKLLRGRSFYVSLLAECAALQVLDALNLPPTSQVVNAAGKFTIIAPNTERVIATLKQLRQKFDRWFIDYTLGQTSISIAWTEASCNDLRSGSRENSQFDKLVMNLFNELETVKLRRFDLCGNCDAKPIFYERYLDDVGKFGVCSIDNRSPANGENSHSQLADDQIKIGTLLVKDDLNRLIITRNKLSGKNVFSLDLDILGFYVAFTGSQTVSGKFGEEVKQGNILRVWDFKPTANPERPLFDGYARRNVSTWVPSASAEESGNKISDSIEKEIGELSDGQQVKTFEDLTHNSIGKSALMTLKGDVDNLGKIFENGFRAPSLSRMTSLSRQIDAFFTVYLPFLCQTEYPDTYTIFAGGDDFFLLGPWSQQLEFAFRLRKEFSRYVANNSALSFSAGLRMTKPKIPVRHLAAMAEESVQQAKQYKEGSKNAVSCFESTVSWSDFEELLQAQNRLEHLIEKAQLSHGYVYSLFETVRMVSNIRSPNPSPDNASWRSKFYYRTIRSLENSKFNFGERQSLMEELAQEIIEHGIERFGANYRIVLSNHIYRKRGE